MPADIRHIVDAAGSDKILFGSDYGLSDWMILADRLDSVHYARLGEADLEKILWRNAARLLHLEPDWSAAT